MGRIAGARSVAQLLSCGLGLRVRGAGTWRPGATRTLRRLIRGVCFPSDPRTRIKRMMHAAYTVCTHSTVHQRARVSKNFPLDAWLTADLSQSRRTRTNLREHLSELCSESKMRLSGRASITTHCHTDTTGICALRSLPPPTQLHFPVLHLILLLRR